MDNSELVTISDSDTINQQEIDRLFKPCELVAEKAISEDYILHLAGSSETNPHVAASSVNTVDILNFENYNLVPITKLPEHPDRIIGVKFPTEDNAIVYTGCSEGCFKMWDLRTPQKLVSQVTDTSEENGQKKEFTCFDVSPGNRLLAAGTDLYDGDAYILFWDIRNTKLLGGYWESHTDDITDIKFDLDNRDKLISGSTDGLINIYDLAQTSEDDALTDTLNTESSIEELTLFKTYNNSDAIACVTHTVDLQLWKIHHCQPFAHFQRKDVADAVKRSSADHCYIVGIHQHLLGRLLLLAGSNVDDEECVRGVYLDEKNMSPALNFPKNQQRIRSSWYNANHKILITGGEKGIVSVWKLENEL